MGQRGLQGLEGTSSTVTSTRIRVSGEPVCLQTSLIVLSVYEHWEWGVP